MLVSGRVFSFGSNEVPTSGAQVWATKQNMNTLQTLSRANFSNCTMASSTKNFWDTVVIQNPAAPARVETQLEKLCYLERLPVCDLYTKGN